MLSLTRQEVLDTDSIALFTNAKNILTENHILCDYKLVYHDYYSMERGKRHLYVRNADYEAARKLLSVITQ